MPTLKNDLLSLTISPDANHITLTDLTRKTDWFLHFPLGQSPGRAHQHNNTVTATYTTPAGEVRYHYTLHPDHLRISLETTIDAATLPLPGPFQPSTPLTEMAIPLYQGVLLRPCKQDWTQTAPHGGHNALSLSMSVLFTHSAALLITHDSPANWDTTFGEKDQSLFFTFNHLRCPVEGYVDASVRLHPVAPSLTTACKKFRQLLQAKNNFITWEQKITDRPIVKNLFGALMAFVGYNKAPDINYADGARQLRAYGFENVLYYPLRMCHYSLDFKMGGDDPIWLSDEDLAQVKAVPGALVGPWGWTFEALDAPPRSPELREIFRHDKNGPVANWRIDSAQWYKVCTPYQIEHIKKRFATDMKQMDWIHFDVNACVPLDPCLKDHPLHHHRPMSAREELPYIHQLFSKQTVGNRIIASEGFSDRTTSHYDIGSTKLMPPQDESAYAIPVPMTMLVFHDSTAHTWWELHNYNPMPTHINPDGTTANSFNVSDLPHNLGSVGSGNPHVKAAIDALTGSAPHVFPFGKQYGWRNFETRESYSFTVKLTDPEVQTALAAALPIARLHKKIGHLEMTDHSLLNPTGLAQSTTFADGTQIIANLSKSPQPTTHHGLLPPHSWREL